MAWKKIKAGASLLPLEGNRHLNKLMQGLSKTSWLTVSSTNTSL
jgi:hypothetical protein